MGAGSRGAQYDLPGGRAIDTGRGWGCVLWGAESPRGCQNRRVVAETQPGSRSLRGSAIPRGPLHVLPPVTGGGCLTVLPPALLLARYHSRSHGGAGGSRSGTAPAVRRLRLRTRIHSAPASSLERFKYKPPGQRLQRSGCSGICVPRGGGRHKDGKSIAPEEGARVCRGNPGQGGLAVLPRCVALVSPCDSSRETREHRRGVREEAEGCREGVGARGARDRGGGALGSRKAG